MTKLRQMSDCDGGAVTLNKANLSDRAPHWFWYWYFPGWSI